MNMASDFQTIFLAFGFTAEVIEYNTKLETKTVQQIPPPKSLVLKVIIPQTQEVRNSKLIM